MNNSKVSALIKLLANNYEEVPNNLIFISEDDLIEIDFDINELVKRFEKLFPDVIEYHNLNNEYTFTLTPDLAKHIKLLINEKLAYQYENAYPSYATLPLELLIEDLDNIIEKANETTLEESNNRLFIEYRNDRTILLNGKVKISKPNFNNENDLVFNILYKNPNKTFTKDELEAECKIKITKPFSKIIENLGFYRGLKSAFFDVSKTSIRFHNPAKI